MSAPAMSVEMIAGLAALSAEDRVLADRQRICPVAESRLGSMGTPKKVDVNGTAVFICCEGCRDRLLREPDKYLAKLTTRQHEEPAQHHSPTPPLMDLPPIGVPQIIEPLAPEVVQETTRNANTLRRDAKRVAELPEETVR